MVHAEGITRPITRYDYFEIHSHQRTTCHVNLFFPRHKNRLSIISCTTIPFSLLLALIFLLCLGSRKFGASLHNQAAARIPQPAVCIFLLVLMLSFSTWRPLYCISFLIRCTGLPVAFIKVLVDTSKRLLTFVTHHYGCEQASEATSTVVQVEVKAAEDTTTWGATFRHQPSGSRQQLMSRRGSGRSPATTLALDTMMHSLEPTLEQFVKFEEANMIYHSLHTWNVWRFKK